MELRWSLQGPDGAPVLVLLNSLGGTTTSWDPIAGALAENFRVARLDHRGHGRSPAAGADAAGTLDDLGAETLNAIDAIRDAARVRTVSFGGISPGGVLAICWACTIPIASGALPWYARRPASAPGSPGWTGPPPFASGGSARWPAAPR